MNHSHAASLETKDNEELLAEKMEKALEESLNTVITTTHNQRTHTTLAERDPYIEEQIDMLEPPKTKKLFVTSASVREEELITPPPPPKEFASTMPPPFDPELEESLSPFALDDELDEGMFEHQSEIYASIDLSDHRFQDTPPAAQLIEDDYTLTDEQFSPSALPIHGSEGLTPQFIASLHTLHTSQMECSEEMSEEKMFNRLEESTAPQLILPNSVDYLRSQWIKRSLAEGKLPDLNYYGLEDLAANLEWEEDIEIQVSVMPDVDNKRYIFSAIIHPSFQTNCETMRQNFYFLIDRSSSIEKAKFSRYKRAVQRSLAALREGDTFNIYLFDKKIVKLSTRNLPVTPNSIQHAEDFLDREHTQPHFASTEVYTSLEQMLPERFHPDELHSIILITDGNTLLSPTKQKKALTYWSEKYDGNVNFYTAASGKGNNLPLLDVLSYTTGGKLLYSDTNAGFPRKMVHLIKDLHNPLIKNVSVEVSSADPNAHVVLYPRNQHLPPMFAGQPYTITGTVDELCDLTLYIQGKNHDHFLNIRKEISLRDANRGGRSLEKTWATAQAKLCYEHFLKNGKNGHLKEAKQIVAPYRGDIAND